MKDTHLGRLNYPKSADSRGSAKKYFKRRAYYFGKFGSPESYILFALWKRSILQTGEAPPVSSLRQLVNQNLKANFSMRGSETADSIDYGDSRLSLIFGNVRKLAFPVSALLLGIMVGRLAFPDTQPDNKENRTLLKEMESYERHKDELPRLMTRDGSYGASKAIIPNR